MERIFSQALNMSLTGSMVILCVMAVRLLLKRAPKIFSYALWSVVLFRLLCPVSLPTPVSLLEIVKPQVSGTGAASNVSYFSLEAVHTGPDRTQMPESPGRTPA